MPDAIMWITSGTRSAEVRAVTSAIVVGSMPCADSSTICARRHVTIDSLLRRRCEAACCPRRR